MNKIYRVGWGSANGTRSKSGMFVIGTWKGGEGSSKCKSGEVSANGQWKDGVCLQAEERKDC